MKQLRREFMTSDEIEKLLKAAKLNRRGRRDHTMILMAYRHGLRSKELVELRWDQVRFGRDPQLHVIRAKNGDPSTHYLRADELRALNDLKKAQGSKSTFVFTSKRFDTEIPFTPRGFALMVERAGQAAGLPFKVHPHLLRHSCGHALVMAGKDTRSIQHYLGHKNIQHTVRYTKLAPIRFKDFPDAF